MMVVAGGATNVTTYFALRLAADGTAATGLTITNIDLQYVRSGAAPSAKVDATALAATDSAHGDNQAIEIDATDAPGLYRVDWPDAAFAAGVKEVILTVKVATAFTEHLRVMIDAEVTAEALGTQAKNDVNAEADTALTDIGLDHLLGAAVVGTDVTDDSVIAQLVSKSATADWDDFDNTTDSLQNIRDEIVVIDDFLDTEIAAILVDTNALNDTKIPDTISLANINAEVVDVIRTDTNAEPGQGTPAATASLQTKIDYLYKAWRNRTTQTAGQYSLYGDDATTIHQKATFSDDATTADRGEVATGP